jgi:hypothetical protein
MLVSLNCAGAFATESNPGASVANPLGREAKEQAEKKEEEELAEAATPDE